ncbi:MAG: hypothetical protein ACF788_09475 [Novipirellula sp. JB048]
MIRTLFLSETIQFENPWTSPNWAQPDSSWFFSADFVHLGDTLEVVTAVRLR